MFDVLNVIVRIKACVHYSFFHQKKTFKKIIKSAFYFTKKRPFVVEVFNFLYSPLHFFFPFLFVL